MKNNNNLNEQMVHVFGLPGVTKCTQSENLLFFNEEYDINLILNQKNHQYLNYNHLSINLESILGHLKKNKKVYLKLVSSVAIAIYLASNPTNTFALTLVESTFSEMTEKLGNDTLSWVKIGAINGILIITALRLFAEYTRGGSKYKTFEILKQCVWVLLILIALPMLPKIVTKFVNNYLPY